MISLERARMDAMRDRLTIYDGGDPLADKHREKTPTFAEAADKRLQMKMAEWKGEASARQWRQSMDSYVLPAIGDMPVDQVTQKDVLAILTPIWTTRPAVARQTRQRIAVVFQGDLE